MMGRPLADDYVRFGADPAAVLRDRLSDVEDRIAAAIARAGRDPGSVRLLPITKTVPARILRLAHDAGLSYFGENKIQEGLSKQIELADLPVAWSLVGHLQTNKAKFVPEFASEFHALDSLRLAGLLDPRLAAAGRTLDVYIQVNTSGEASKYGQSPSGLLPFVEALHAFPRLRPRGLMTLALLSPDIDKVRPCFERLRRLRDKAIRVQPSLKELSMGMSGDYEAAILEGADVVRVGRSLFGARPTPPGHYWPGMQIET